MSTPSGATVTVTLPGGTTADVTEAVQALYDLVVTSMDWGSGFLTIEDAAPVGEIAELCGFDKNGEIERYLLERKREDRRAQLCNQGLTFTQAYEQAKRELPDPE